MKTINFTQNFFLIVLVVLLPNIVAATKHPHGHAQAAAGTTRTSITYGPFHVLANSMYPHTPYITSEKPCEDCYLLAMHTELEYLNGTVANFDSEIWLHHLMQFNNAQTDPICEINSGNYFYGVGNERPVWNISAAGPYGYYVGNDDEWVNGVEIMNESKENKDVQITVTYEWISASSTEGKAYKNAELIWVNVGDPCGNGEVPPRDGISTYTSEIWKSTVAGPILTARAHTHDGGINSTLYINGEAVCVSDISYMQRPGYIDDSGISHISGASSCTDIGMLQEGDELHIEAVYNSSKTLEHDNKKDNVMAVMFMYVGSEEK